MLSKAPLAGNGRSLYALWVLGKSGNAVECAEIFRKTAERYLVHLVGEQGEKPYRSIPGVFGELVAANC